MAENGTAFTLRHTAPHTKLHAGIKRISTALNKNRAIQAAQCGVTLGSALDEKRIPTIIAAQCVSYPLGTIPRA